MKLLIPLHVPPFSMTLEQLPGRSEEVLSMALLTRVLSLRVPGGSIPMGDSFGNLAV